MSHCVFLVAAVAELVGAEEDAVIEIKSSGLLGRADPTQDVACQSEVKSVPAPHILESRVLAFIQVTAELGDFVL